MTTMNRLYCLYSEDYLVAQLDERELGFGFMHSSIDRHTRESSDLDTGLQL